jgi:hypothetical protein
MAQTGLTWTAAAREHDRQLAEQAGTGSPDEDQPEDSDG